MYELLVPAFWKDYELIDCGDGEKLERFGKYILQRPEPQALWNKKLSNSAWQEMAHATFKRSKKVQESAPTDWQRKPQVPESWSLTYQSPQLKLQFRLAQTAFGHIGIFPEQAENWEFISQQIKQLNLPEAKILNLFAYTGAASLAAAKAGATVVHLDSVRQTVTWANQNAAMNEPLAPIHWVVEDAMRFVQNEVRRNRKYDAILLDPPAYGRGPKGEKWLLEDQINDLMRACSQLLRPKGFFLINIYAVGLSALVLQNLAQQHFGKNMVCELGELCLKSQQGDVLPLGTFLRFTRNAG